MERWVKVPSNSLLEASSYGRVRSLPYEQNMPRGGTRTRQLSETYGCIAVKGKYRRMLIRFQGSTYKVHQLVCEAFHGLKPFARAVVRHTDEDATNNSETNMSWSTQKENMNDPKFIEYCRNRRRLCLM